MKTVLLLVCLSVLCACDRVEHFPAGSKRHPVETAAHTCRDGEEWQAWDELLEKYPDDRDMISLYALRVGLCAMIERKMIEPKVGIDLFEQARHTVIGKIAEEEMNRKKRMEM